MEKDVIGFIGIGNMGKPMAQRLLAAGKHVVVYDTNEQAAKALESDGATLVHSIADMANAANIVLMSLPTPAIVREVVGELIRGKKAKQVINFSTIGPAASVAAATILRDNGMAYIDAPVSGGVPGAQAGTLAVMVSCDTALFEAAHALLSTFGKPYHVGEQAGQAQTMKLVNNLLSATAIAITSEAMTMGVKGGLDPRRMLEVINAGSGRNSATQDKFPRSVLSGTFDYGFGTGLAYKDVRLCVDEAAQLGVPMVVGSAVREMLAITQSIHGPGSDYTSVCQVLESWAGVEVRG